MVQRRAVLPALITKPAGLLLKQRRFVVFSEGDIILNKHWWHDLLGDGHLSC